MRCLVLVFSLLVAVVLGRADPTPGTFSIGVGISDITGPASDLNMMGYAQPSQKTTGIHFRLRARAFVVVDETTNKRMAYVSCDLAMVMESVFVHATARLAQLYPGVYGQDNVILSAIHTHSGPGAYSAFVLYDITSFGWNSDSFWTVVNGIVRAVQRAHDNVVPHGRIFVNRGKLNDANRNRSPSAYLNNPQEERDRYADGNTDRDMVVLRLQDGAGKPLGAISFFAVHCTSMNNTNTLISGDNKGHASALMEAAYNAPGSLPGTGPFVAAFGQSNEGDVSPNTAGAKCPDGTPCDMGTSTCNGRTETCIAAGPGVDMRDSTRIIGEKQYQAARALFENATTEVVGKIDSRFFWVKMSHASVSAAFTSTHKDATTCAPAMGDSFAAGTTDGPGAFNFKQGSTSPNPFFNFVIAEVIHRPTPQDIMCQSPKPIFLDLAWPGQKWIPETVPLQLTQLGQLVFVAVPSELTTMSGRRVREAVYNTLTAHGWSADTQVIIAGVSNGYSGYTATYEEYQVQRYEGASTTFGPHQLALYTQELVKLAESLATSAPNPQGVPAPTFVNINSSLSFILPPGLDTPPPFKKLGDVSMQPSASYRADGPSPSVVTAVFWAGNPRHNMLSESSFLTVDQLQADGSWSVVRTDSHWDTEFVFKSAPLGFFSRATVRWTLDSSVPAGTYRITHNGYGRHLIGGLKPYSGSTKSFTVTNSASLARSGDVVATTQPTSTTHSSSLTIGVFVLVGAVLVVVGGGVAAYRRAASGTVSLTPAPATAAV
eukprot:gnl/Spiro4/14098_TR7571_c0_g1_i1.p1 gnl/Spiro4/14098_TR7571_c0_g1~~gnl/Spiro4/14098_TR7571_c0_g1_i1.p1  ORF type:complete len:772 (+),score=231.04 gnl/Spiro4/14098_TR7571_c0_g1_i1:48-2363(+)